MEAKAFLLFTEEQGRKSALGSGNQVVCDYQVCLLTGKQNASAI